ncbi:MAG: cupin domain-containing protein [Vicinamibacterales bacterium]|nr:cupin domain-containing protein [Vicinamibacterales bacterium]
MTKGIVAIAIMAAVLCGVTSAQRAATAPAQNAPLAQRIVHYDPSKVRKSPAVHDGAGVMNIGSLLENEHTDTNLWFFHRGNIPPKTGIGAHFHNNCEEMFIILDGEAQFTIDGHTALLKGPAGAPVRMGHSHAVYNPTDKPVEWMNINVAAIKGMYDAFNLGDSRASAQLEPIASFMTLKLDKALLRPVERLHGGKGTVHARRALDSTVFLGNWGYVDHLLVPPGASIGSTADAEIGGFYYVLSGEGTVTVGSESATIKAHDTVPLNFNQSKSFEASGTTALELMAVGVVKEASRRIQIVGRNPYAPARN